MHAGTEEALAALREGGGLLMPGGPCRVEILLMNDLLRKQRRSTAVKAVDVQV